MLEASLGATPTVRMTFQPPSRSSCQVQFESPLVLPNELFLFLDISPLFPAVADLFEEVGSFRLWRNSKAVLVYIQVS